MARSAQRSAVPRAPRSTCRTSAVVADEGVRRAGVAVAHDGHVDGWAGGGDGEGVGHGPPPVLGVPRRRSLQAGVRPPPRLVHPLRPPTR
jgi:hypothetical protein